MKSTTNEAVFWQGLDRMQAEEKGFIGIALGLIILAGIILLMAGRIKKRSKRARVWKARDPWIMVPPPE